MMVVMRMIVCVGIASTAAACTIDRRQCLANGRRRIVHSCCGIVGVVRRAVLVQLQKQAHEQAAKIIDVAGEGGAGSSTRRRR